MAVRDLPLAILAAVDLRGPQLVATGFTADRRLGVLVGNGVGHVADHVSRDDLERVRRTVREKALEVSEEPPYLFLPAGRPQRAKDGHRLIAGPDREAGCRVPIVQRLFGVPETRFRPF